MIYYILSALWLVSFGGLAFILGWQIRINRRNHLEFKDFSNYGSLSLVIDYLAFKIGFWVKRFAYKTYLFSLHFIKNSISFSRYVLVKLERRFNRFVARVPGPEGVHTSDKISSFLKEIKEHKENVMAELQSEAQAEEGEK